MHQHNQDNSIFGLARLLFLFCVGASLHFPRLVFAQDVGDQQHVSSPGNRTEDATLLFSSVTITEFSIADGTAVDVTTNTSVESCSAGLNSTTNNDKPSFAERIQIGKSVLTLESMMTPNEIEYIIQASVAAAEEHRQALANNDTTSDTQSTMDCTQDSGFQGQSRMPTLSASQRQQRRRRTTLPCSDTLSKELSTFLEDTILKRVLTFVDSELTSLSTTLFHLNTTKQVGEQNQTEGGIAHLFDNEKLVYSNREPAINIYVAPGGQFGIHRDNQALTMLIPLSKYRVDFDGGGTAFYSDDSDIPSLVLAPPPGTAILFCGSVRHSGMAIERGTRIVFVASFSRKAVVRRHRNGEMTHEYV